MALERDPFAPTPPPGQDDLPFDDGEPMETGRHRVQMNLLIDTLAAAWAERQDVYVAGNMFVYFSELQTRGEHFRGPDVFVVLDTAKRPRKSWVVWEEGGRLPDVVIELLSPSTEAIDRGEKMRLYARVWRTGTYVLYDPFSHALEGYALDATRGEYVPIAVDERGDVPIPRLGFALGIREGDVYEEPGPFLRWIDAAGAPLPADRERAAEERARAEQERARAEQERARAEQERARAEVAERRLAELEDAVKQRR